MLKIPLLPLCVILPVIAAAAFGQCPTGTLFPGAQDTDANLTVAVNNLGTNLTATLSPSDTTMVVASTVGWLPYMMATVDTGSGLEIVYVTGINSSTVMQIVHPCEGTIASSHAAGAPAVNNVTAYTGSTAPKSAIKAIEAYILAGGLTGIINTEPVYDVPYYAQSPTGSILSGDNGMTYNQPAALFTVTNASVGTLAVTGITGTTQCLTADSAGNVGGTGSPCGGGGGGGTINPAAQYDLPYYSAAGPSAVLSGSGTFTFDSGAQVVTVPNLTLSGITGSTQCLQVDTSGVVSGIGLACCSGGGGSGTVTAEPQKYIAYYTLGGTNQTVAGTSNFTFDNTVSPGVLTAPHLTLTSVTSTGNDCLYTTTAGVVTGTGAPCGSTNSGTTGEVAFYATSGTTLSGNVGLTYNVSATRLITPNFEISGLSGTQCLQEISGLVSGTGTGCGTIAAEQQYDVALYTTAGTAAALGGAVTFQYNTSSQTLTSPKAIFNTSLTLSAIAGSNQCLQVNSAGLVSGLLAPCVITAGSAAAGDVPYFTTATGLGYDGSFNYDDLTFTLHVPGVAATSVATSSLAVGGGSTQLYRCTSAGTLRTGQITSVSADCGASVAIDVETP